jgi:methylase of polypeptide subunit release factors
VAVNINPDAVECAQTNAKANGVADRIRFLESDVFDRVEGRFDLIVFDPPFRWYPPRDMLEAATTDRDYQALTGFMAEATDYLSGGGRILLSFGTSADLDYHVSGPELAIALTSRDFAVLDASSEPLLPVREKNNDRLAFLVLDLDSYSV